MSYLTSIPHTRLLGWVAAGCLLLAACTSGPIRSVRRTNTSGDSPGILSKQAFVNPPRVETADHRRAAPAAPVAPTANPRLKTLRKPPPAPAVAYRQVIAAGIPMHVVQIDPRRPEVQIAVATSRYGIGYRDNWSAIIDRTRPAAAITGTYFCTQTAMPVGSIIMGGQTVHAGVVRTAFAFTTGHGARLLASPGGSRSHWAGFETVLGAGPRLLTGGQVTLWPHAEGFRDPAVFARKRRSAVAITRHGKLLLVAVEKPILLRTLAGALQSLGAVDAMSLDGGASTGLYHRGKTWVKPGRALTNLLVVYDSTARYQQHAGTLIPVGPRLAQTAPGGRRI